MLVAEWEEVGSHEQRKDISTQYSVPSVSKTST
jgi:hypothetical protein